MRQGDTAIHTDRGSSLSKEKRAPALSSTPTYGQSFSSVLFNRESVSHFSPRKTSPRFKDFPYTGPYAHMINISTRDCARYFRDTAVVSLCLEILMRAAKQCSHDALAYCFMPDHLHLLVQGTSDDSDLQRLIWGNPVRAGLVECREQFPYSGPRHLLEGRPVEDRPQGLSVRPVKHAPKRTDRAKALSVMSPRPTRNA